MYNIPNLKYTQKIDIYCYCVCVSYPYDVRRIGFHILFSCSYSYSQSHSYSFAYAMVGWLFGWCVHIKILSRAYGLTSAAS